LQPIKADSLNVQRLNLHLLNSTDRTSAVRQSMDLNCSSLYSVFGNGDFMVVICSKKLTFEEL
jgi:hypothetical protein